MQIRSEAGRQRIVRGCGAAAIHPCGDAGVEAVILIDGTENTLKREYKEQDIVNVKAAALMGKLHDKLKAVGYDGHPLELYLVRLLFILFADDTTIFDKDIFIDFIEQKTAEDGSDLAARLSEL